MGIQLIKRFGVATLLSLAVLTMSACTNGSTGLDPNNLQAASLTAPILNQNRYFQISIFDESGAVKNTIYQLRHIRDYTISPDPSNAVILASFNEFIDGVEDLGTSTYRSAQAQSSSIAHNVTEEGIYFPNYANPHFPLSNLTTGTVQISLSASAPLNNVTATLNVTDSSTYTIEYLNASSNQFFEYTYVSGEFWTALKRYRNDNGSKGALINEYTKVDFDSIPSHVQTALQGLE